MLAQRLVINCMKTSKAFLGALTLALGLSLSPVTHGQATITQTDLRRAEDRKLLGEIRARAEMGDARSQLRWRTHFSPALWV